MSGANLLPGPVGTLGRLGARQHARGRGVMVGTGKTDGSDWQIVSVPPRSAVTFALRLLYLAARASLRRPA